MNQGNDHHFGVKILLTDLKEIMTIVVKVVHFIRVRALNTSPNFQSFMSRNGS